jgi:transcriptional regulator of acetoin/glycerol metabolism
VAGQHPSYRKTWSSRRCWSATDRSVAAHLAVGVARDEPAKALPSPPSFNDSLLGTRQMLERAMIQRAGERRLQPCRAARSLGISRVTLYKKLKKYGLEAIPIRRGSRQSDRR